MRSWQKSFKIRQAETESNDKRGEKIGAFGLNSLMHLYQFTLVFNLTYFAHKKANV